MAIDYLDKVRKMIDKAEGEERVAKKYLADGDKEHYEEFMKASQAYRERAESMMLKFRIDQEQLIATDRTAALPLNKKIVIINGDRNSEFDNWLHTLFLRIAEHCGCRAICEYHYDFEQQDRVVRATIVGYEMDVAYAELLWMSARLTFGAHVDPRPDDSLSERENIYVMRKSGMPRKEVAQLLWGQWTHSNSAKIGRIFKEECIKRGDNPDVMGRGFDNEVYRKAYAREFVWRVHDRLREARDAAGQKAGAIELSGRKDRVDEEFYKLFPEFRPQPTSAEPETPEAAGKLKKPKGPTAAEMRRTNRLYHSPSAQAGAHAGYQAGSKVNIQRTTTGEDPNRLNDDTDKKEIDA